MKKHVFIHTLIISALSLIACTNAPSKEQNAQQQTPNTTEVAAVEQNAVKNINAEEFITRMTDSSTVVIDVRTPSEVHSGYIEGADLFIDINGSDFESQINALDKTKTYLMYCRSGARSGRASQFMVQQGFTSVCNLNGGIMNYTGKIVTP